jgi:hypothetical protein
MFRDFVTRAVVGSPAESNAKLRETYWWQKESTLVSNMVLIRCQIAGASSYLKICCIQQLSVV